jgi:hypothetical protein
MPNLYWIGSVDAFWENPGNWKFNANGSGASPSDYPWKPTYSGGEETETTYGDYDLIPVGSNQVVITSFLGSFATGTCSIPDVSLYDTGNTSSINSGKWTGGNLMLSTNCVINGGEFTNSIVKSGGYINGGKFSENAISVSTDGQGNTTLTLLNITLAYPTPASGGGGGINIGGLIGLPSFIKI